MGNLKVRGAGTPGSITSVTGLLSSFCLPTLALATAVIWQAAVQVTDVVSSLRSWVFFCSGCC